MPMLPDPAHMDIIDKACISAFEAEEPVSVFFALRKYYGRSEAPHALPVSPLSDPCRIAHCRQQISGETEEMLQKRLKARGSAPERCRGAAADSSAAAAPLWAREFLPAFGGINAALQNRLGGREEMTARCLSASLRWKAPLL